MQESPAESGDVLITSWQPFIVIDDDDDAKDDDDAEDDDENDDYVRERPLFGCGDLLMTSGENWGSSRLGRNPKFYRR